MNKEKLNIGGRTWIDLVNTRYVEGNKKVDLFISTSHLWNWLIENNIIAKNTNENVITEELVSYIKELRKLCEEVLISVQSEEEIPQVIKNRISKIINDTNITINLLDKANNMDLVYTGKTIKDNIGYIVINDLIDTLNHYDTNRLRQCYHENCICYFLDTSKSGKRKWCDMETCGNRKKATKHYQRHKI
ncbi:CGNR zinc finger domain-containing protein [Staphylococcus kloosii]|uniref:CGNR zinc finger domain-containing protein n=1 Tax=Staphylococcus kloosii TaxID=29384 RepID=UPI0028A431F2|nr:CGNR zinc finger domain-containing protein [Staphylococcus kloosii]MDT3958535.1 CGNR zinc finger domain-containing protein [Staphylococcus kloosii]